jgi:hypothetical protein
MDIVQKLRAVGGYFDEAASAHISCKEVADEIESLEAAYASAFKEIGTLRARIAELEGRQGPEGSNAGWISVEDRLPPKGELVQVYVPANEFCKYAYDEWNDIHEAPVSFSSATICVGEGWLEHEYEEVSHWMPLPAAPSPADSGEVKP